MTVEKRETVRDERQEKIAEKQYVSMSNRQREEREEEQHDGGSAIATITTRKTSDSEVLSPYGFVYMPDTLWQVPQQRPRVCVDAVGKRKPCGVCPIYTEGVPRDALTASNWKHWKDRRPSKVRNHNPEYYYKGYYSSES